jgi:hypothetical protein
VIDNILVYSLSGAVLTFGLIYILIWVQEKRKKDPEKGKIGKLLNILFAILVLFVVPWVLYFLWAFLKPGPSASYCDQRTEIGCDDLGITELDLISP